MTEPVVHLRHVRMIRRGGDRPLCASGIRAWCERHGVDADLFFAQGVPGELCIQIGDAFALKALNFAREEAAANGLE